MLFTMNLSSGANKMEINVTANNTHFFFTCVDMLMDRLLAQKQKQQNRRKK